MPEACPDRIILAADIGGTNLSLALMARRAGQFQPLHQWRGSTKGEGNLGGPLRRFLAECAAAGHPEMPAAAGISAAGPLAGRRIAMPNGGWAIDAAELERQLGIPVRLMNDFMAVSHGVLLLDPADPAQLHPLPHPDGCRPAPDPQGPVLIVGAGTGLGVGYVTRPGGWPTAHASEGGHIALPLLDDDGYDLWRHLRDRFQGLPDAETAVSGPGIAAIHAFLVESGRVPASPATAAILALAEAERPAAIAAQAGQDAACGRAMDLFVDLYARVCSELATVFLPTGGLFLAGGIAGKNAARFLDGQRFMRGFRQACRPHIHGVLQATPVYLVRDYSISLHGAAHAACLCLDAPVTP